MWTKKNDHASKSEGANFLIKGHFENKIQVWPFSCLLLGFTCLHFLLNVSKTWLANLLTTIFTKKNERFVLYMWHVPCVVHWALFATRFMSHGRVCFDQILEIFFSIIYQDPSVSKCNQLRVDIFRLFFINLRYVLKDSCKMISNKPDVSNLNWFICKQR